MELASAKGERDVKPQPAPVALLICLVLLLEGACGRSFFKPLTCNQDPFNRKTCGGEAERFYPNQCLKKECCYRNQTCYYHVIDGVVQSRNAGILGGAAVAVVLLSICLFFGWKFRDFQKKERKFERPQSVVSAESMIKLLDEESEADDERIIQSLPEREDAEPWTQRRESDLQWGPAPQERELELELEQEQEQEQDQDQEQIMGQQFDWSPEPLLQEGGEVEIVPMEEEMPEALVEDAPTLEALMPEEAMPEDIQ